MSKTFDLTEVLFRQRSKPRGDELDAHAADLYGCDRATWYRRKGLKPLPFTREKLAQFAMGLGYEYAVANDLIHALGFGRVLQDEQVDFLGLTGHPDLILFPTAESNEPDLVIEVKTTELQTPKAEVSPHYAVQAAFYALALKAPRAVVLVKHARSHAETTYEINPEGYRALIEKRAAEVLARTEPTKPEPRAEPGELAPWGCKYCNWTMCERNPDHGK